MTWVLWRQHRTQVLVLSGVLAAAAVLLAVSHHSLGARPYHPAPLHLDDIDRILVDLGVGVPLLLGVFLGVPLLAREVEHGTNVLVWTQTVTRRRWLTSKLLGVLAATIAWSAALTVVVTWWSDRWFNGSTRFEAIQFDTQNVAPVAYAVFAVALGFAAGAVLRRMLPAVGVTVGAFLVVRVIVEVFVRPHLAAVQRIVTTTPKLRTDAWILSQNVVAPDGRIVHGPFIPAQCLPLGPNDVSRCIADSGYRFTTTLQPLSHYWPIQWTEAAIFVALASMLIAAGAVVTLRRDA